MRSALIAATLLLSAIPLHAQTQPQDFSIVSIHLTEPHSLADLQRGIGLTSISGYGTNKFTARNTNLQLILQIAFAKDDVSEIVNQPDWLSTQLYDIVAEADTGAGLTVEQFRPLLRHLLETRFHLKTHTVSVRIQGYALMLAQEKPNLQLSTQTKSYGQILPDGMQATAYPMKSLAGMLRRPTGQPVVDETGLTGAYDFKLNYAPRDTTDSTLPDIFTALKEQLGLKLQPKKITVVQLIIDHADRIPEEN